MFKMQLFLNKTKEKYQMNLFSFIVLLKLNIILQTHGAQGCFNRFLQAIF